MSLGTDVLIIDDDPVAVEVMKEVLENAGYTTVTAHDPFHGLRLVREMKPSLVLCDFVMPHMAGADVFRTLASDPATAKIPRVLVSGRVDPDVSCANAFLAKPFDPCQMLRLVKRMTRSAATPNDQIPVAEPVWRGSTHAILAVRFSKSPLNWL